MTSDFYRRNRLNRSGLGRVLVLLGLIKPSTRRVDSAATAAGMDELSTTAISSEMTDDMAGWSEEKRDLIAEESSRTRRHYHSHGVHQYFLVITLKYGAEKKKEKDRVQRRNDPYTQAP